MARHKSNTETIPVFVRRTASSPGRAEEVLDEYGQKVRSAEARYYQEDVAARAGTSQRRQMAANRAVFDRRRASQPMEPHVAGPVQAPQATQQAVAQAAIPAPVGSAGMSPLQAQTQMAGPPAAPNDAQSQFIQAGIRAGVFASEEEGWEMLRGKTMMR